MRATVLVASGAFAAMATAFLLACATPNLPADALDEEGNGAQPPTTSGRDAGHSTPPPRMPDAGTQPDPMPTPSPQPDAGTTPTPTNACAMSAGKSACYQCCETANPAALSFLDNEWGKCACEVPGVCANACANSYCAGLPVQQGSSCDSCLAANNQSCSTQAESKCNADATCKKLFQCDQDSSCTTKP
jgi:hypothetical protein